MTTERQLFYEENGRVAAIFWEWRHKVILLCASALGGVLVISAWLYERRLAWELLAPFVFGAVMFWFCFLMDIRIATVLGQCYERGYDLETLETLAPDGSLLAKSIGVYSSFHRRSIEEPRRWWDRIFPSRRPKNAVPDKDADAETFDAANPLKGSFTLLLQRAYVGLTALMLLLVVVTIALKASDPHWLESHNTSTTTGTTTTTTTVGRP